jgi:hypothetical protein
VNFVKPEHNIGKSKCSARYRDPDVVGNVADYAALLIQGHAEL